MRESLKDEGWVKFYVFKMKRPATSLEKGHHRACLFETDLVATFGRVSQNGRKQESVFQKRDDTPRFFRYQDTTFT